MEDLSVGRDDNSEMHIDEYCGSTGDNYIDSSVNVDEVVEGDSIQKNVCNGVDVNFSNSRIGSDWCIENGILINGLTDIVKIDMTDISPEDVARYDFANLEVAFLFYSWYARFNGFSPRRDCVLKSKNGELLQQTFVCSRSGYKDNRLIGDVSKRRRQRKETRCGCRAKFRVHIDVESRRWYVSIFNDNHKHEMLPGNECALLPKHRKMTTADVVLIENLTAVGIRAPHIYGCFANTSGGYDKVGFILKDIYNQIARQKKRQTTDANEAVKFLQQFKGNDPLMYVTHTFGEIGRLENLFWSDGESQMNYKVFGDVVAFDATYKKNRYKCPIVIFSGVNHHNQTTMFATALVSHETDATYAWLLEQFMHVMKKPPMSVITDGYTPMINAINKVFPNAHHRLCAWHLQRNATTNIGIPEFMSYFNKCMFGDYDVSKFERLWSEMISKFGLEHNNWCIQMYAKRKMWATSHIRGHFFAGLRTTSRCEALHSHMGKYVHSRISLRDFVEQFQRCLSYFRFNEFKADFKSGYGDAILETNIIDIERSASIQFTGEIYLLFIKILNKVQSVAVTACHETSMYSIFSVSRYCDRASVWQVSYCSDPVEFRCTCLRMESMGLPCEHIIVVMLWLDITELPKCLILDRWTKRARDAIGGRQTSGSLGWDSHLFARYACMHQLWKKVCETAYRDDLDYHRMMDLGASVLKEMEYKRRTKDHVPLNSDNHLTENMLQNPLIDRTDGSGRRGGSTSGRSRRISRCSICGKTGHNRRSCPIYITHVAAGGLRVPDNHDEEDEREEPEYDEEEENETDG